MISIKVFKVWFYPAVCDVNYSFTMYDIGSYGNNNDSGFLTNSTFGKRLESY